ncbi:MAG TPA: Fe-S cluster assembly protein SufD [Limnochordia bacterium]|nr:Fe-S cluster assembly protein SufD [Limnochordia bacterium]
MSATHAPAPVGEAEVGALSAARGEPEWMRALRLEALAAYRRLGLPSWDRTDPKAFKLDGVTLPDAVYGNGANAFPSELSAQLQLASAPQNTLVLGARGRLYAHLDAALRSQGVLLLDLHTALCEHPELVQRYFAQTDLTPGEDKFTALHCALWTGGAFVYVPKGVVVEAPLQIITWAEDEAVDLFPHIIVAAEREAAVTVIERQLSRGDAFRRYVSAVEVSAAAAAQVRYGCIQDLSEVNSPNYTIRRGVTARDAKLEWVVADFGSSLARSLTRSRLDGEGSESYSVTVFFGSGRQHLDTGVTMQHLGRHTTADMLTRGVLTAEARSVYRGLTDIERGARGTSSFQTEKTLMLSADARADAIPGLEIDDSDVSASHSATTGQIDPVQLFYLMSRGLDRTAAVRLIVDGFFAPVLGKIGVEGVDAEILRIIDRKMEHA